MDDLCESEIGFSAIRRGEVFVVSKQQQWSRGGGEESREQG